MVSISTEQWKSKIKYRLSTETMNFQCSDYSNNNSDIRERH